MTSSISAKNKGIIISLILILVSLCFYHYIPAAYYILSRYSCMLIFIAGIFWTLNDFRKHNSEAGFKEYFNEGFKNFIVVTFLLAAFTFLFYKIYPLPYEYENFINTNAELLLKEGNRTADEINQNAAQWRKYFMPLLLSIYNFTFLILGSLVSAVLGYIFSKK